MADSKAPAPAAEAAPAPAKKSPVKAIAVVAALMVAEAAVVYMFVGKTGPQAAVAHEVKGLDQPDEHATVEIPLMEEKFQNMQTGRVWIWDTEVVLKVRSRHEAFVTRQLESRAAEIKETLSLIFRRAQHNQLKEPGLETINRQVTAALSELIGKDPEGKDRIERVVIPKCRGFPAD